MKKLLTLIPVAALLVSCNTIEPKEYGTADEFVPPTGALGVWNGKARQVTVADTYIDTLGQNVNNGSPTNSIQAYIEWIDDNWGQINTNNSYYYLDGTTQNMWRLTVRDWLNTETNAAIGWDLYVGHDLIVSNDADIAGTLTASTGVFDEATIGDLTVTGTLTATNFDTSVDITDLFASNDMAQSFMGYPKLSFLSESNVTRSGTGTLITSNSFANAFDLDRATATSTGVYAVAQGQQYEVDLGDNYVGVLVVKYYFDEDGGLFYAGVYQTSQVGGQYYGADLQTGADNSIRTLAIPAAGRYIRLAGDGNATGAYISFYDISFYGVTNGFENMGGW